MSARSLGSCSLTRPTLGREIESGRRDGVEAAFSDSPTPTIDEYAAEHSTGPDEVQRELQAITAGAHRRRLRDDADRRRPGRAHGDASCARWARRRAVEVGTFTGYSALAVARGLGPDGRLLCCDVSEEWTAIARDAWERAGVADRIDLRIGPGVDTLRALPAEEQFDFAFIDADKTGYPGYYEEILAAAAHGRAHPHRQRAPGRAGHRRRRATDESVVAIRELNDAIVDGPRACSVVLLPIGDGVSVVQKI